MTIASIGQRSIPEIPLLFNCLSEVLSELKSKSLLIFLDYDGTLTPIVPVPSEAKLCPDMKSTLLKLVKCFSVNIVTGRGRQCIEGFLGCDLLVDVSVAASHGFDVHLRDGRFLCVGDSMRMEQFRSFKEWLRIHIKDFPIGCFLEETGYSVSLHYRDVEPKSHRTVEIMLDDMLKAYPGLHKCSGKKVFEARLFVDWDKGRAVDWIIENSNEGDLRSSVVIYLGDDITDEDAFSCIKHYPGNISIIVAADGESSRTTWADYRIRDQSEVLKFFNYLLQL
jgi:trehalose 6-phosphate phosphatase